MSLPFGLDGESRLPGLPGVPDGLVAYAPPAEDRTVRLTRTGPRYTLVRLRAAEPTDPARPAGLLSDADWRWATSTQRRRDTVVHRFGPRGDEIAVALCRAGCVALLHGYVNGRPAPEFRSWVPHPALVEDAQARAAGRADTRAAALTMAVELAAAVDATWPGVAAALRTSAPPARLTWIVRAAGDLVGGMSHDGPRAFVQHHADDTKKREDVVHLLLDAGFEPAALVELGIDRSPYIGVAGPVQARLGDRVLDLTGWPGPVELRLPADRPIVLTLSGPADDLVVVENRQAAETVADRYPDTALIWCHGQPPEPVLDLIARLAGTVRRVLICPDADLGGVRIAARVHDAVPAGVERVVVDAGAPGTASGRAFGAAALAGLAAFTARADGVGELARACVRRGHGVEQEAPIRSALVAALTEPGHTLEG